ncbi:MAG: nucleotide exchange factor GrpE [Chloroflexi bacterium]|nr:nucleotide exchange factor GrpE [Chloroflexota bacterium]
MAEAEPRESEAPDDQAPRVDDDDRPTIRVTDRRAASGSADQPEADAGSSEPSTDEAPDLERRHRDLLNRLTRVQADFANYRRRTEADARERASFANMAIAFDILRVIDGFERAFQSLPSELRLLSWVDGIALTQAQLLGALEAHGVTPIECKRGDAIDTAIHEVVMSDDGDGPMAVAEQLQRGYRMHDRVLRPTLVKSAPAASLESEAESTASDDAKPADGGVG